MPKVFLNGQFLPFLEARISPLDCGFLYGFSLFETLRVYNGRLFRLSSHLARLRKGARIPGIIKVPEDSEMEKAIGPVLAANNLKDARLRLTLSIGEGSLAPDPSSYHGPTFVVAAAPFNGA